MAATNERCRDEAIKFGICLLFNVGFPVRSDPPYYGTVQALRLCSPLWPCWIWSWINSILIGDP